MELDLDGRWTDWLYPILASLVTPRPIALATNLSPTDECRVQSEACGRKSGLIYSRFGLGMLYYAFFIPHISVATLESWLTPIQTLPANVKSTFKPGLGIITYQYIHHGTRADVTLQLEKYSVR